MKKFSLKNTSKFFKIFLVVQIIILIFTVATSLHSKQSFNFSTDNLHDVNINIPNVNVDDADGYKFSFDGQINEEVVVSGDKFSLRPGAYSVTVDYLSKKISENENSFLNSTGYLELACQPYDETYTTFDNLKLRDGLNSAKQNIQITSILPVNDLQFNVRFTGFGDLTVKNIRIEEIVAYRFVKIFFMLLLFLVFDAIWFLLAESKNYRYKKELGMLTVMCVMLCLPFVSEFSFLGHDLYFHINRITSFAAELAEGNLYPYIYTHTLNGYGYLNPIFYSQSLLYIPAILFNCGFKIGFCVSVYNSLVSVATCLVMYWCALKIFKKSNLALIAAALYSFSTYRLINVMLRTSVGEYTAQIFLPLVFLGFYNIYTAEKGEKITISKYLPIIIGLTGIIQSHTLSIVMSAMIIGVFCLVYIRKTLEWNRFFALAKAAVISFAVNIFYLLPFIDCMSMDLKVNSIVNNMQNRGINLANMFNPMVYGASLGAGHEDTDFRMTIGFAIVLGLFFFAFCALQKDKLINKSNEKMYRLAGVTFGFTALTILLSTEFVPYNTLRVLPQSVYNILTVYQFPWRWLTFGTVFGVICTVAVIDCLKDYKVAGSVAVSVLIVGAMMLNAGQILIDNRSNITVLSNDYNTYTMIDGDGEYLPAGTENRQRGSNLHYRHLMYGDGNITVDGYKTENGITSFYAQNSSAEASYVDIPVLKYDNYVAYDEATGERLELTHGFDNRIRVNLPAGYAGNVAVSFHIRKIWLLAAAVSALTVAGLAAVLIWHSRKNKKLSSGARDKVTVTV